ncbi:MAG: glycosyltransferase family 2 protein [Actinomycetota bacterium]|nr:glycosyltransferase family 2 protein [Actinomycetota bacterium]
MTEPRFPNPESLRDDLVTIVIPARNEEDFIGRCLDSVLAQTEENLQVIVVDGASTDRTADIVRSYMERDERVELHQNPDAITPKSLNVGLEATKGKWFVRVDAHAAVPPDYVKRTVHHLRTGNWGGVGGRKDGVGVTVPGRAIAAAMASKFGVGNSLYHYGTEVQTTDHIPFGAYDTSVLIELEGWDERLVTNQDFELDYRLRQLGKTLLFDPDIAIEWHSRQTVVGLFRQYRRYGRGKADVARLHPESVELRHLAAPALVGSWAVALPLLKRYPKFGAAVLVPYAAALTVATILTSRKLRDPQAKALVAPSFAAMHVGWGIGFWEGLIKNPRRLPALRLRRLFDRKDGSGRKE